MKKQLVTVLVAMMISPAFADHVQGHFNDKGSMAKEGKVEQLKSELGLTDDQTKKIEASREKFKPQIADLETKAKTARDQFASIINNPNASSSELESAYKQKQDAQRSLEDVIFSSRMEHREILTPDQRAKMISNREDKMEKKQERREKFKEWKKKKNEKRDTKSGDVAPTN